VDYAVYSGPTNFNRQVLLASVVLPGDLLVYGCTVYSTNAAAQFVNFFDNSALPADGAVPLFSWPLAAHNGVGFSWAPNGRRFYAGLVLCNSSTDATKTIGAADCFFDVQYDLIADGNVVSPVYEEQNAPGTGE
jgi:hypothetical protein